VKAGKIIRSLQIVVWRPVQQVTWQGASTSNKLKSAGEHM
jgi:hypothetical protein